MKIRETRKKLGLSVNKMAEWLETDERSIRRMENGKQTKIPRRMLQLCDAYMHGYIPKQNRYD